MGGKRYDKEHRIKAVKAAYWEHENIPKAVKRLLIWCPDLDASHTTEQLYSFVKDYSGKFGVRGTVMDERHPGQPPAMPDDVADRCIELLFAGYKRGPGRRYFSSIRQALVKSAELRAIVHQYYDEDNAPHTLLRRLKQRDPTLHRRTLRFIKKLKKSAKNARLAYCERLLHLGEAALHRYLARVVWVDAKKLYVCPKPYLVYAPRGATAAGGLLVGDDRLPGNQFDVKKIMYYAGVNSVLGACHLKICTGTTKYRQLCEDWPHEGLRTYKVGGVRAPASKV